MQRICDLTGTLVNQTSADGLFSLDATRCLGACGLAPVVVIDGKVYGNANGTDEVEKHIQMLKATESAAQA